MNEILLIDSQVLTRRGLIQIIAASPVSVNIQQSDNVNGIEDLVEQVKPQMLIMDPFFGNLFSLDELAGFMAKYPLLPVLITYNVLQRAEIVRLLDMGIKSFLSKTASKDEVINAVEIALLNKKYFCKNTSQLLFGSEKSKENPEIPTLSPREKEIIHLIAEGLPDNAIAQKLFLSFHTIRTHRKNITKKLGFSLKNAAELVWLISYLNDVI